MSQYSDLYPLQAGGAVSAVLNSQSGTITYTVTAPTGQVANLTLPQGQTPGTQDINSVRDQIRAQGGSALTIAGFGEGLRTTGFNTRSQAEAAQATATATNTSVPAAPSPTVPLISTPAGPVPASGENAAIAAGEVVAAPIITPTITATPLPPQDIGTGTGFGDDDTSVFPTTAPAQVQSGTGFGDDDTSVFPTTAPAQVQSGTGFGDDDTSVFPTAFRPTPIDRSNEDEFTTDSRGNSYKVLPDGTSVLFRAAEVEEDITQRDAFKTFANQQATLRARYVEPSSQDWRVRLVLAGGANYLYEDDNNSILKPLQDSNGVIFPYTPQISTSYNASYDETQLTHSNYRGYFYKGSHVGDISITATFTAQDTREAQYLLAVIHFFRSVTKMFYGQDAQRGTPPPLVYLIGFGEYQFNGHACLVSSFQYNLPSDVDYIRATGFNNYGENLLNRRAQASQSFPGSSLLGSTSRLLASKLLGTPGAESTRPDPGPVTGGVNNTVRSTYVPTKMEIGLTLKPVQSRAQMSREFSLKNFANGNLLKGGYW
jgi:hypothetical protein